MTTNRFLVMDIFLNIIFLVFFYGLLAAPVVMISDGVRVDVLLFIMAVVCSYFFVIRRVIKPVVPMFLAHIIVLAVVWFLAPGAAYVITYFVMTILLMLFSLYQRYRQTGTFSNEFIYFVPIVFIALALLAGYLGHGYVLLPYTILVIIICVGTKLHVRMYQVNASLEVISQNSTQPVTKILAFDYKAMLVLGMIMVGLIIVIFRWIIRPLMEFVSRINPFLGLELDVPPVEFYTFAPPPGGQESEIPPELLAQVREPFILWRILEFVLFYIAVPLAALGLLILLIFKVRDIFRQWRLKSNQDSELSEGFEDIKEFIRTPKIRGLRRRGSRSEHRIRRLFRETVTRHIKKGVPIQKSDTPMQIARKITTEDIDSLAEEYGAVRYK